MSKAIHFVKPFKDDMWASVPHERDKLWPNGWGGGHVWPKNIYLPFFSLFRSEINSIL